MIIHKSVDFVDQEIVPGSYHFCTFTRCGFSDDWMPNDHLVKCHLVDCAFMCNFYTDLYKNRFTRCGFHYSDFENCDINSTFKDCTFSEVGIIGCKVRLKEIERYLAEITYTDCEFIGRKPLNGNGEAHLRMREDQLKKSRTKAMRKYRDKKQATR